MAYFECIVGNGGGSQTDIPLIVNCDDAFAGLTITATQGQLSYSETCPSTSPYQVVFHLPVDGTWVVSGTVEGTLYSESITISTFELDLKSGFDWEAWVTAGGLDPTDYSDLSDVFADEAAVRRLMLVHASADYLAGKVSNDVNTLDDFVANDTAMKWLGLSDYLVDKLVAITGAEAKLLGSTYWERYLKDHVPTMTSNTVPYGEASASSVYQTGYAWKAFDGIIGTVSSPDAWSFNGTTGHIIFKFTNPICAKKFLVNADRVKVLSILGSNDGTNYDPIVTSYDTGNTSTSMSIDNNYSIDANNNNYYLYIKMTLDECTATYPHVYKWQIYGRSLDVSVPVMTSNVLPYGEAISSGDYSSNDKAYIAFNNTFPSSSGWYSKSGAGEKYLAYKATSAYVLKAIRIKANGNYVGDNTIAIQGSNTGDVNDWADIGSINVSTTSDFDTYLEVTNSTPYLYHRVKINYTGTSYWYIRGLQFYGLSYSEKEFETGATKKWLYDHGLEVEPITTYTNGTGTSAVKNVENLEIKNTTTTANTIASVYAIVDLTNYNLARCKFGDVFNASTFQVELSIYSQIPSSSTTNRLAYVGITTSDANLPNNAGVDISSISSNNYVSVNARNGTNGYIKDAQITEIWLE